MHTLVNIRQCMERQDGTELVVFVPKMRLGDLVRRKRICNAEIRFDDGRHISAEQRKKAYATIRDIADWAGYPPEEMKEILVYSNCPQVELIVNGVPQGIKKRNSQDYPAAGLHWNCKLQAGENTVIALSKGKAVVADTLRFVYETRTWGKPAQLQAKVTHCGGESSGDISMVEVQLTDAKGVPCLDAVNYIEFGLAGDGQLIENQGTSTGSRKVQAYNGRAAIRVDKRKGESVVSVRCDIPEVKTVFVRL